MKSSILLPLALILTPFLSSCANSGGEEYDVSNPYAAADYPAETSSPYETESNVNPAYDTPAAYEDTAVYETPATNVQPAVGQSKVHTVVRGDTLWGLGKQYNVSVDAIKAANGMTSDVAVLGAQLQIPAP